MSMSNRMNVREMNLSLAGAKQSRASSVRPVKGVKHLRIQLMLQRTVCSSKMRGVSEQYFEYTHAQTTEILVDTNSQRAGYQKT